MYIYNYEVKSDTEAILCIQGSVPCFTAWDQFQKFACELYIKYIFYHVFDVMY